MADVNTLPLSDWSRWNAVLMLCAAVGSAVVGQPWPLVVLAVPSFLMLIGLCRGRFTPRGSFGAANAVTALRLALVVQSGISLHDAPGFLYGGLVLGVFALDGVDGWLARKTRSESPFGSHFDMETDALFVLLLGLELWQRDRLGAWVLIPGLLRYVYVLCLAAFPARRGDMPRFTLGRRAFVALMIGLSLAFLEGGVAGTVAAALGCALVCLSFAISFRWSYG